MVRAGKSRIQEVTKLVWLLHQFKQKRQILITRQAPLKVLDAFSDNSGLRMNYPVILRNFNYRLAIAISIVILVRQMTNPGY
jgi:hypothetical protein